MESALVVSSGEKSSAFFAEALADELVGRIVAVTSGGQARALPPESVFDLVIINAPLPDEPGDGLARVLAARGAAQVILMLGGERFEELAADMERRGVLALQKPVSRTIFKSVLRLAKSAEAQLRSIKSENSALRQKLEDIKLIDRAKCILIPYFGMSEQEAHRYIEKQAMDMRATKRAVAEGIIKTYEY